MSANRCGLTVLELLVAMSIVAVLMALLLPALGMARESSRRIQCVEHLREVGIALHCHHHSRRSLPTGWSFDPSGQSAYGWIVPVLPYLEQVSLAEQIDCEVTVTSPWHDSAGKPR